MVPLTTIPGGNPVTAVPGLTPRSPVITLGPVLVTVLPARTANDDAVPRLTGAGWLARPATEAPAVVRAKALETRNTPASIMVIKPGRCFLRGPVTLVFITLLPSSLVRLSPSPAQRDG